MSTSESFSLADFSVGQGPGRIIEEVAAPSGDVAEIDRRFRAFRAERSVDSGALGELLLRRMAVLSVRVERLSEQLLAAGARNVVRALEEFVAPEGLDEATVSKLRRMTADLAKFVPSKEACLARQHEAAAERGFYRALKELLALEKQVRAGSAAPVVPPRAAKSVSSGPVERLKKIAQLLPEKLGSSLPGEPTSPEKLGSSLPGEPSPASKSGSSLTRETLDTILESLSDETVRARARAPLGAPRTFVKPPKAGAKGSDYVPISVGKAP